MDTAVGDNTLVGCGPGVRSELQFAPGSLLVSEIFGPTIQGEGRNAGVPAVFVRTAHCNVHCTW